MYEKLISEITEDPLNIGYTEMSDEEVFDSLSSEIYIQTYSRFISIRACAAILSDIEYATFRAFLNTISGYGDRYADMVNFLSMPCSDSGETGGIDFGLEEVRLLIDNFGQIEGMFNASVKLKSLAEKLVSRASQLGISVGIKDIIRARRSI